MRKNIKQITMAVVSVLAITAIAPTANAAVLIGMASSVVAQFKMYTTTKPVDLLDHKGRPTKGYQIGGGQDGHICGGVVGFTPTSRCSAYIGLGAIALSIATHNPIFMGIFLLDSKVSELSPLSEQVLVENGYTDAQAQQIMEDTIALNEKLISEEKVLSITGDETSASIRKDLKEIAPNASEEFLDVYSQRLSLAAQAQK